MMILKYFALISFCLCSFYVSGTTRKATTAKAGDDKTTAQLKQTCSKGKLKRRDFSAASSYQSYVTLCNQSKRTSSSPSAKRSTKSSTTHASSPSAPSGKIPNSPRATTSIPQTTNHTIPTATTMTLLGNNRSSTTVSTMTRRGTQRSSQVILNRAQTPAQISVGPANNSNARVNTQVSSNHPIASSSMSNPTLTNTLNIHTVPSSEYNPQDAFLSSCQEQFNGPANKFKETICCQPMFNFLESEFIQSLMGTVQAPITEEKVTVAFVTLTMLGYEGAQNLLGLIRNDFYIIAADTQIAEIIPKPGQRGVKAEPTSSSTKINHLNKNLAILKNATKVADSLVDSPRNTTLKASLFAAIHNGDYAQANVELTILRDEAAANLNRAKAIKDTPKTSKNAASELAKTSFYSSPKEVFDRKITKLQTLCPSFSFTVKAEYPTASASSAPPSSLPSDSPTGKKGRH